MTDIEKKALKGLISEYELKVKYNNNARDYEIYSMLLNVQKENKELKEQIEKQKNEIESWKKSYADAYFDS